MYAQEIGRIEAEPKGAADTGPTGARAAMWMRRQEGRKMRAHADGPHAGTASAVRNAEGLVQVEMADIRAELAGADEAHLRVEVRAIQIDLAAILRARSRRFHASLSSNTPWVDG